jgi:hypothetical protein
VHTILINVVREPSIQVIQSLVHEFIHTVQFKIGVIEAEYDTHGPYFYVMHNDLYRRLMDMGELTLDQVIEMANAQQVFNPDIYQQIDPYWH